MTILKDTSKQKTQVSDQRLKPKISTPKTKVQGQKTEYSRPLAQDRRLKTQD